MKLQSSKQKKKKIKQVSLLSITFCLLVDLTGGPVVVCHQIVVVFVSADSLDLLGIIVDEPPDLSFIRDDLALSEIAYIV